LFFGTFSITTENTMKSKYVKMRGGSYCLYPPCFTMLPPSLLTQTKIVFVVYTLHIL